MAEASLMDVTEIFDTVRDAELQIAQQTLEGMDITLLDPRLKQTVLFFAAARVKPGALKLTRICLNKGVQLDAHDSLKQTPLYYAAKVGNLQVARLLIGLGMDPNFRDTHGQTAVFYAVLRGHLQMMRLLSGMGAALDVRSNEGKTPSHMTKSNELKTEIRRLIAEHKARAEHEIHRCGKDPNKILEVKKLQDQIRSGFALTAKLASRWCTGCFDTHQRSHSARFPGKTTRSLQKALAILSASLLQTRPSASGSRRLAPLVGNRPCLFQLFFFFNLLPNVAQPALIQETSAPSFSSEP